ncbi:MAG: hypothetical protein QF926_11720 [Alphaproteobacteria bacterium]|jgi:alpha-ketoglutarate-dependent taurine dioxygenase|nr:hypothetical protein [Alphaproteobacteria bacterium]
MALDIRPLCVAHGAEVCGLDLTEPLAAPAIDQLQDAYLARHLSCFRSDPLDTPASATIARHFGEPQLQLLRNCRDAEVPEVSRLNSTYETPGGKPDDLRQISLHQRILLEGSRPV